MRSIRQNIRTAVLKCRPNEIRCVRKTKAQIFSVRNEQLVNKGFVCVPAIYRKIFGMLSENYQKIDGKSNQGHFNENLIKNLQRNFS